MFHDKVALITGAERGIGYETAKALHARGASVVLVDLDLDATEQAAATLGDRALGLAADVTDREAIGAAVDRGVEHFGGIDICMANAGIAPRAATVRAMDPDAFERVIDVNLLGVYRTVHAAMPQIIERRGHFVVVASIYAFMNGALVAPYACTKAGVEQLGRTLRTELVTHGASASVAYFGFIDTEMVRQGFDHDSLARRLEEQVPRLLRRRLTPAQAAAAVVEGIERRAPRIIAPRYWAAWSVLRGLLNPPFDKLSERRAQLQQLIAEADDPERESAEGLPGVTQPDRGRTPAGRRA